MNKKQLSELAEIKQYAFSLYQKCCKLESEAVESAQSKPPRKSSKQMDLEDRVNRMISKRKAGRPAMPGR